MPDLEFQVDSAQAVPYSASPLIHIKTRIIQKPENDSTPAEIHSISLRCQIRIEPGRRKYSLAEQEKLFELYGEPHRWGQTVRSTLWINTALVVPAFRDQTVVEIPVPCTYDFNVAMMKYFYALEDGDVPLCLLFSGTIFYAGDDGALQIAQISWEKEANFRLPVSIWKNMMEIYYPNSAWLCLHRDVFDRLYQFKTKRALPTWEQAIERLIDLAAEPAAEDLTP